MVRPQTKNILIEMKVRVHNFCISGLLGSVNTKWHLLYIFGHLSFRDLILLHDILPNHIQFPFHSFKLLWSDTAVTVTFQFTDICDTKKSLCSLATPMQQNLITSYEIKTALLFKIVNSNTCLFVLQT